MTLRDKLIAGGTDLESVDAVLRNGDMSVEPDKVLIDAEGDSQMSLRDYFAAHAPAIPVWFHRETTTFDSNDPAGLITRWAETEEQHMVRWRWHYADAMLAGDDAAVPELLSQLLNVEDVATRNAVHGSADWAAIRDIARAAIAKATGKAP